MKSPSRATEQTQRGYIKPQTPIE